MDPQIKHFKDSLGLNRTQKTNTSGDILGDSQQLDNQAKKDNTECVEKTSESTILINDMDEETFAGSNKVNNTAKTADDIIDQRKNPESDSIQTNKEHTSSITVFSKDERGEKRQSDVTIADNSPGLCKSGKNSETQIKPDSPSHSETNLESGSHEIPVENNQVKGTNRAVLKEDKPHIQKCDSNSSKETVTSKDELPDIIITGEDKPFKQPIEGAAKDVDYKIVGKVEQNKKASDNRSMAVMQEKSAVKPELNEFCTKVVGIINGSSHNISVTGEIKPDKKAKETLRKQVTDKVIKTGGANLMRTVKLLERNKDVCQKFRVNENITSYRNQTGDGGNSNKTSCSPKKDIKPTLKWETSFIPDITVSCRKDGPLKEHFQNQPCYQNDTNKAPKCNSGEADIIVIDCDSQEITESDRHSQRSKKDGAKGEEKTLSKRKLSDDDLIILESPKSQTPDVKMSKGSCKSLNKVFDLMPSHGQSQDLKKKCHKVSPARPSGHPSVCNVDGKDDTTASVQRFNSGSTSVHNLSGSVKSESHEVSNRTSKQQENWPASDVTNTDFSQEADKNILNMTHKRDKIFSAKLCPEQVESVKEMFKSTEVNDKLLKLKAIIKKNKRKQKSLLSPSKRGSSNFWIKDENAKIIQTYQEPEAVRNVKDETLVSSSNEDSVIVLSDSE